MLFKFDWKSEASLADRMFFKFNRKSEASSDVQMFRCCLLRVMLFKFNQKKWNPLRWKLIPDSQARRWKKVDWIEQKTSLKRWRKITIKPRKREMFVPWFLKRQQNIRAHFSPAICGLKPFIRFHLMLFHKYKLLEDQDWYKNVCNEQPKSFKFD